MSLSIRIFKNPSRLATSYTIASVFLGPLIYILGYGFTRGGGDYCDAVYYLPNGMLDPRRVTEFQNAQLFQVAGASLMLALGLAILVYSFVANRRKQSRINMWAILGVVLMMLGYIAVILLSGKSGQSC